MMTTRYALAALAAIEDKVEARYYAAVIREKNAVPTWIENEIRFANVGQISNLRNESGNGFVKADVQYHGCPME